MGTQLPSPKGQSPQFSAHVYCGQMAGCIQMPLGMEVGLGPGHTVLDGNPAPPQKGGRAPKFLAHIYCGQAWCYLQVKLCDPCLSALYVPWCEKALYKYFSFPLPLGTEVCLSLGDIMLDGDPAPDPQNGTAIT